MLINSQVLAPLQEEKRKNKKIKKKKKEIKKISIYHESCPIVRKLSDLPHRNQARVPVSELHIIAL